MEVIRQLAKVPTDINDKPKVPVLIVNCGEVDDPRNFLNVLFLLKIEMYYNS